MNDQEYERGELITDWSTVKQGDMVLLDKNHFPNVVLEFCAKYKDVFWMINKQNSETPVNWYIITAYRAIPKKKKVIKYLYEYIGPFRDTPSGSRRKETEKWFKNDDDFKSYHPNFIYFHRLDWTARPFDE
jgi:hypothetical protein